jgi:hypothetical protein
MLTYADVCELQVLFIEGQYQEFIHSQKKEAEVLKKKKMCSRCLMLTYADVC